MNNVVDSRLCHTYCLLARELDLSGKSATDVVFHCSSQARSLDTEVVRAGDIIWMLVPLAGLMTVLHFDGVMPATQQTRKVSPSQGHFVFRLAPF